MSEDDPAPLEAVGGSEITAVWMLHLWFRPLNDRSQSQGIRGRANRERQKTTLLRSSARQRRVTELAQNASLPAWTSAPLLRAKSYGGLDRVEGQSELPVACLPELMCQTRAGESGSWFGIAPNEARALAMALAIRPPIGMIGPSPARTVRDPAVPKRVISPSQVTATPGNSAAGSAWARLPHC